MKSIIAVIVLGAIACAAMAISLIPPNKAEIKQSRDSVAQPSSSAPSLAVDGGSASSGAPVEFQKIDIKAGSGAEARQGSTIAVLYTGWLYDAKAQDNKGSSFDSSGSRPFTFQLGSGSVINGWDQGFGGMKVGGKRQLIIPAEMGYGSRGSGSIPPNAPLIFDVELLEVR
jgi:FKBP-type peptidyl-prolyl cis-trans isomerase FkpA